MEKNEFPKFQIRPALAIPGEEEMVEIVMWYNRNQANVFRMNTNDLRDLKDQIVDYLKPEIGHHRREAAQALGIKLPLEREDTPQA